MGRGRRGVGGQLDETLVDEGGEVAAGEGRGGEHGDAAAAFGELELQAVAGLDDLAVDGDAAPVEVDPVGGEGGVFALAHA